MGEWGGRIYAAGRPSAGRLTFPATSAHNTVMRTSTPAARRGLRLSSFLFAAGTTVAFVRFFVSNGSTDGLFFLFVTLMAAAIAVYARVALLEQVREKVAKANSVIDNAPVEHLATVHQIRTPETSDAA